MLQVAAYCRVSTDKEDQANSFEAQQRYFREYIQRQPDWELQGIYADEGFSGTSTNKRVEFNKMLHAAELGQIDLIVTKEVSRFTRNTVDALQITRELRRRGVGVLFLNDSLDTRTNDGELRLTIMSSFAQDESRRTSERSKWGQMRSMEKGVVFGGSLLGYDVIGGKMTVNPEGAEVVRLIFHKYLQERKGCSTIARELREAGILSSKGNCLWSSATVTKILKNEKYCGDLIQKKTYTPDFLTHEKKYNHGKEPLVELKDHHEPIIDRETWQAVQRELSRRNRATGCGGHGNRYPLSGKIRCGECGKSFSHRTKKRQDGSSYYRWCCFTATNEGLRRTDGAGNTIGCSVGRQIRDDIAMDLLRRSVNDVTLDKKAIISNLARVVESVLASGEDSGEQELRRLELEFEKLQARSDAILDRFERAVESVLVQVLPFARPVQFVQMHDGQAGLLAQPAGERALPRTAGADKQDSLCAHLLSTSAISRMISPASANPAAPGTNEMEPGAPGAMRYGSSWENTAFTPRTPRFRSCCRTVRASGQTVVFSMSAISNAVGSSLLPAPMAHTTRQPALFARSIKSSLDGTESMQSATKSYRLRSIWSAVDSS